MAFLKFSMIMVVLASAYAKPAPQYYAPPPPPPPVLRTAVPPPPPPPAPVYHAGPAYHGPPQQVVPIVSQSYDAQADGSYAFQYESADGSARQEQGISRSPPGHEGPGGVAVQGRYTYPSELGPIQVDYIADENGFQPSGNNIHPEIVKAVAAQVAFARSEPPTAYNAPPPPPPVYARTYAAPPPPPPAPVVYTHAAPFAPHPAPYAAVPPPSYPFKA